MIRVNLLPQKRGARSGGTGLNISFSVGGGGATWLLVVLGVVLLECVGLWLFQNSKEAELKTQQDKNQKIQGEISDIQTLVANHQQVKDALTVLRAREDAIAKLQAARTGPTAVLLELAQILTRDRGPTTDPDKLQQLRKENPLAVFNPGWDTRRLWLTSYAEGDRVVKIEGQARDAADVSEFAQRLKLSVYFYDVQMLPGKKDTDPTTKIDLASFALSMKVRY